MPGVMNALFEPLCAAGVPKRKERAVLSSGAQAGFIHSNSPDVCPNGGWWHGVPSLARICEAQLDAAGLGLTEPPIRNTVSACWSDAGIISEP